jgi:hypothetical protein
MNKKSHVKKILMKFTSRSRFNQLKDCIKKYYDLADDTKNMRWLFSFDIDDESYDKADFNSFLHELGIDWTIHQAKSENKIDAINRDVCFEKDWDILLNISDDQMPVVQGYDNMIRSEMDAENTLSLWFNDGHQDRINTQEIVGQSYYNKLGYIYHPSYKSLFCDNESTEVAISLGKMKKINTSIIRHYHPSWQVNSPVKEDDLYRKNQAFWSEDERNYHLRKSQNFPNKNFTGQVKLTICIPSVTERNSIFTELYNHISNQIVNNTSEVQILCDIDNKEVSIGAKRQRMLQKTLGEYVTMVDDDDFVADDFVERILAAIEDNSDFIGFEIECSGTVGKTESVSNKWNDWGENIGGYDYVRTPYHKSPIKTEIARQIGFKDMRYGEDYDFSKRLKQSSLIKTESFIQKTMYFYRYKDEPHNQKYGITGQGQSHTNNGEIYRPAWR